MQSRTANTEQGHIALCGQCIVKARQELVGDTVGSQCGRSGKLLPLAWGSCGLTQHTAIHAAFNTGQCMPFSLQALACSSPLVASIASCPPTHASHRCFCEPVANTGEALWQLADPGGKAPQEDQLRKDCGPDAYSVYDSLLAGEAAFCLFCHMPLVQ